MEPKVMGLDIMFFEEYDGDQLLVDAIEACPNLVLPLALDEESSELAKSYFYDTISNEHFGVINLDANAINHSVRTHKLVYQCNDIERNSFASEMISIAYPDIYQEINQDEMSSRIISYPSVEFPIIDVEDLMGSPEAFRDTIADKIILLGDVTNVSDYHLTPISAGMSGVIIHAHTLDTIISGKDIRTTSKWTNWLLAFIICYAFMCAKFFVSDKSQDLGQLITRILQLVLLYLLFTWGCNIFINKFVYIDFSPVLLMLTIALLVCDLWEGFVYLFNVIFRKSRV